MRNGRSSENVGMIAVSSAFYMYLLFVKLVLPEESLKLCCVAHAGQFCPESKFNTSNSSTRAFIKKPFISVGSSWGGDLN